MASAAAGRRALQVLVRGPHLVFGLVTQGLHAVTSVQGHSNLLVCAHESLQFSVQLDILSSENVAVVLQGVNLGTAVCILLLH